MSDLPKKFMAAYGHIIRRFLHIENETMSEAAQKRLDDAPALERVEMDGVYGVKPEPSSKAWFQRHRLPVFFRDTLEGSASALFHATRDAYRIEHDDDDIALLLNHTYFGRLIDERGDEGPCLDFTHHRSLTPLPGFYTHGIKALLRRNGGDPSSGLAPLYALDRIEIDGAVITPSHSNWGLAKIHLLVAMDNETLFTDHAVGHLNNNFIEAAAKRTLSDRNPLRLLLAPHFGFAIALDEMIMELFYKHSSPGNPFGLPVASIYQLINKGFEDDRSRGLSPTFADTIFNRALAQAHAVIYEHVSAVLDRTLDERSPMFDEARAFAEAARESVRYFPRGADLTLEDVKTIAARFVHESTFVSSTDHVVTKSDLGYFRSIFRIRRPFSETSSWKMTDLFQPIDTFQRVVFRKVFSGDDCPARLIDVEYDPALGVDIARFKAQLRDLSRRHPGIFPLDRIGASIDI